MTNLPSIEYLEKAKRYNINFCDCIECGSFRLCFDDNGLCLDCWEILETYWWLASPLESLSIVPDFNTFALIGKES